ncbi:MAG: histidinol dehydrogenase [Rhodopirellula sp.]|nr:histidinol dehydrogenase [Rhodopirellula sp.]|tara:strand:+ start:35517 stop:36881 length:1365 start_codon:yes stop_codon:yes gene_type:complete
MNQSLLSIQRIDTRRDDIRDVLGSLRTKLSPQGNIVSEAGRQRTIAVFGEPLTPQQVVERICSEVQDGGLEVVLKYNELLDGARLTPDTLRVSEQELEAAHQTADPEFLATIGRIRDNIMEFQSAILHKQVSLERPTGVKLTQRYTPMKRAGLCIPGGAAAYPSTVLMTAVPAMAAGVEDIAMMAPPTDFGSNNPDLLATCYEIGIKEVYRMGGAHGVAALAYGLENLQGVDIIVGPGNLFVALAKKLVYGQVAIDSIAGPSEVVVIADETTRADYTAADLLAQAEHAPGASILVTWSEDVLEQTAAELERQVATLSREDLTRQSLEDFGALILVKDQDEAVEITNLICPEHLHIAIDNPYELQERLTTAGATFMGNHTPVALGDYVAGPSHTLPTSGTARWASGLSSNDFLRSSSVLEFSRDGMLDVAVDVQRMADKEGLTAHRASVDIRVQG